MFNVVARYHYGPWGELLYITNGSNTDVSSDPTHIANINPIRYRGYYYDTETGFYFLQSRYYDPQTHRFINADDDEILLEQDDLLGYNLFMYCLNDPINRFDDDGYLSKSNKTKLIIGAAALAAAVTLTVLTGGGAAAVAVGVAKIAGSVAASTAINAGWKIKYLW